MLLGFFAGIDPALVAAAGAAVLLVTRRVKPEKVWRRIDWDLLMLFVGLFVVIGGAEAAHIDQWLFARLRPIGVETIWGLSVVADVAVESDQQRAGRDVAVAPDPARCRIPTQRG